MLKHLQVKKGKGDFPHKNQIYATKSTNTIIKNIMTFRQIHSVFLKRRENQGIFKPLGSRSKQNHTFDIETRSKYGYINQYSHHRYVHKS